MDTTSGSARSPPSASSSPAEPVSHRRIILLALAPAALLACGETYVDTSLIDDGTPASESADVDAGPAAEPDTDGPETSGFASTLASFTGHARDISEVIVDDREQAAEMLADLEADWALIESIIREEQPDRLFGFSQAVDLVRSGVERNRPADVSKGWKLLADLSDDYPT